MLSHSLLLLLAAGLDTQLQPIPMEQVRLKDSFFGPRLVANRKTTIPAIQKRCEEGGLLKNFQIVAGKAQGARAGKSDADAIVYGLVEAIAQTLRVAPDPKLQETADAIVETIAAAQKQDGYLFGDPAFQDASKHWSSAKDGAELFCAGRLIEAAVAYKSATGKTKLLDVARKLADRIEADFGPGKRSEAPARGGIEMALADLARATGEKRYEALARSFVDRRAGGLSGLTGPATSALELCAGAAALTWSTGDTALLDPLVKSWNDTFQHKTSLTGALAVSADGALANTFDLSSERAPLSTSAAIALAQWSQRMYLTTGDAAYCDAIDRVLYNALPAAVALSGDAFLESGPAAGPKMARSAWNGDDLFPVDVARFLPSIGDWIFAVRGNSIYVSAFLNCEADIVVMGTRVHLAMETDYPLSGRINIKVEPEKAMTLAVKLRRPVWCKAARVRHDTKEPEHDNDFEHPTGRWEPYEREYVPSDALAAHFFAPVRREEIGGRTLIVRGPQLYSLEGVDNGGHARAIALSADANFTVAEDSHTPGASRVVRTKGLALQSDGQTTQSVPVTAIQYALWGNRGASDLALWLPSDPGLAEPPAK